MSGSERIQFTQISLFSVLLGGRYGGIVGVGEVKKLGNLAIATMDRLDGEVQMIDGVVYQACADGSVRLPGDEETIPFGTVAAFRAEQKLSLNGISSYEQFEERMKELCPRDDYPPTVRRQEQDGVGLAEAAKDEAVFEWDGISGDLVGFRLPGYLAGVNAPGWHLHFMDADRRCGGHVVNFSIDEGKLGFCLAHDFRILLPGSPSVFAGLDLNRDWSREQKKAEAER